MKNIVVIGGGTGTFMVLSGLKKCTHNLAAIVSMADSGGSSGILRDELGVLPPGDIRRCLVALSNSDKLLRGLFNYRFSRGGGLSGHNFGNLFLSALEKITGSFEKAVEEAARILVIDGSVIPVVDKPTELFAKLENGQVVRGETNIDIPKHDGNLKIVKVWLKPKVRPTKRALEAIKTAAVVVIGPGDLFSSLIPNLLIEEICQAIRQSRAKKIYVCNLVTKFGETHNFAVSDFVEAIENYLGRRVLDWVFYNTARPPRALLKKYASQKSFPVLYDKEKLARSQKPRYFGAALAAPKTLFRHNSEKLARLIMAVKEMDNVIRLTNEK